VAVVHLLSNPGASNPKRVEALAAIRAAFRAQGCDVVDLRPPSRELIAPTIVEARHDGVTRLAIAGGDGLVHNCLPAIAGTDVPVGLIALGTGNDFARALNLPTDPEAAVDAALRDPTPIDLIAVAADKGAGEGGDVLAATVVTGGFSGRVTARANRLRFPRGQHRYTIATFVELARLDAIAVELTVDGVRHDLEASLFAIGNTRYFGGGMAICPDADPTDQELDVTIVGRATKLELARVLPTVFSGRHVDHPSVTTYRGRRIELTTDAALWADGEPLPVGTPSGAPHRSTTSFTIASGALLVAGSLVGT
jgi:diacylglycerol kinase (ATP)